MDTFSESPVKNTPAATTIVKLQPLNTPHCCHFPNALSGLMPWVCQVTCSDNPQLKVGFRRELAVLPRGACLVAGMPGLQGGLKPSLPSILEKIR